MPAVFSSRKIRLNTTHNTVVASLFNRHSLTEHCLYGRSIIKELWMSVAGSYAFNGFHLKLIRSLFGYPDTDPGHHHTGVL